jgi:hypothetical protein
MIDERDHTCSSAPTTTAPAAETVTVSAFLDRFLSEYVKPQKLRSIASVESRIKVLKQYLGDRPVSDLQEADVLNWFKDRVRVR